MHWEIKNKTTGETDLVSDEEKASLISRGADPNKFAPQKIENWESTPNRKPYEPNVLERGLVSAFRGVQSAIAAPLAVGEALIRRGFDAAKINPLGIMQYPGSSLADYAKNAWAQRYEGVRGLGDNPLNVLGFANLGNRAALALAENPLARAAIRTGTEAALGAGGGALQAMAHPEEGATPKQAAAFGGALGGGLTALGAGAQIAGKKLMPGLRAGIVSTKVTPQEQALVRANLDQIMSDGALPKTQGGYLDLADKMRLDLGPNYEKAQQAVPSDWASSTGDLEKKAEELLLARLAARRNMRAAWNPDLQIAELPADASAALKEKFGNLRATQAFEQQDPEWINISQLADARTAGTDPVLYQAPTGAQKKMLKDVSSAWHEAITGEMMGAPGYAEALGPETGKKYALAKALEKVVTNPGRLGLAHRVKGSAALSPWLLASSLYKAGQFMPRTAAPMINIAGLAGYPGLGYSETEPQP